MHGVLISVLMAISYPACCGLVVAKPGTQLEGLDDYKGGVLTTLPVSSQDLALIDVMYPF